MCSLLSPLLLQTWINEVREAYVGSGSGAGAGSGSGSGSGCTWAQRSVWGVDERVWQLIVLQAVDAVVVLQKHFVAHRDIKVACQWCNR